MVDDYEQYEAECKKIRKKNKKLLDEFAAWLEKSNLKEKTINNHVGNIDFYINEFLLYEDTVEAKAGVHSVRMFLGYWFIKKATWSSPAHIKGNAASLKKFYTFMHEHKSLPKADLDHLTQTIKEEMPEWIATVNRYDDPSIENMEDVWGL